MSYIRMLRVYECPGNFYRIYDGFDRTVDQSWRLGVCMASCVFVICVERQRVGVVVKTVQVSPQLMGWPH